MFKKGELGLRPQVDSTRTHKIQNIITKSQTCQKSVINFGSACFVALGSTVDSSVTCHSHHVCASQDVFFNSSLSSQHYRANKKPSTFNGCQRACCILYEKNMRSLLSTGKPGSRGCNAEAGRASEFKQSQEHNCVVLLQFL
jgi:hypothetical protein